jgi:ATP-dependent RNA helicase DDX1
MKIKWSKNEKVFENAYDVNPQLKNYGFYPAVCMKNAEIKFNFGETAFVHPPKVK